MLFSRKDLSILPKREKGRSETLESCKKPALVYRELEARIAFDAALGASFDSLSADQADGEEKNISSAGPHEAATALGTDGGAASGSPESIAQNGSLSDPLPDAALAEIQAPETDGQDIVFIDTGVEDLDALIAGMDPAYEIILLDSASDGVEQMADALSSRNDVDAIHIISHGDASTLYLGNATLNTETMGDAYAGTLANIGSALSETGDILIYGCNFGEGVAGQQAALQFSLLTGADIAASDDPTGSAAQGGDWDLEITTGSIETQVAVEPANQESWDHLLATAPSDMHAENADTIDVGALDMDAGPSMPALTSLDIDLVDMNVYTAELRLNFDTINTTGWDGDLVSQTSDRTQNGFYLSIENNRLGYHQYDSSTETANILCSTGALTAGEHSVALVFNNLDVTIYIDGALAASGTASSPTVTTSDDLVFLDTIDGQVEEIRVWNVARSDTDISNNLFATLAGNESGLIGLYTFQDGAGLVASDATANGYDLDVDASVASWTTIEDGVSFDLVGLDTDVGDSATYSLTDDASGNFSVHSGTGTVSWSGSGFDTSSTQSHDITARVTDGDALTYDETFHIGIGSTGADSLSADASNDSVLYGLGGDDNLTSQSGDDLIHGGAGNDTVIFSNDYANYSIHYDSETGYIVIHDESAGSNDGTDYLIGVESLQFADQTITVTDPATQFNTLPIITSGGGGRFASLASDENIKDVTTIVATDGDGDTPVFSISGGADAGLFTINSSTGVLSFVSAPDYESPADNDADNGYEVEVQVSDGNGGADNQSLLITISNVDEPTVLSQPGTATLSEDSTLTFSTVNGNAISVSAEANEDLTMTLGVGDGILSLAQTTGLTFSAGGNDQASMTFSGSMADINAALEGLVYTPNADFNGAASLNIDVVNSGWNILTNETVSLVGYYGTVLDLNPGEYAAIPGLLGQPANVTLAAWVNLETVDASGSEVISLGDNVGLRLDVPTFGVVGYFYDGSAWQYVDSGVSIEGTGWHHVAYVYDAAHTTQTLYIDGVAAATLNSADAIAYDLGTDTYIGTHGDGKTTVDFDGQIDDARIYTAALNASDIEELAHAAPADSETIAITVNAVNDAPALIMPGIQSMDINGNLIFGSASGTAISIADVDDGGADFEVTLTAANGTVTLSGLSGLTFSTGDGTSDVTMTFTGSKTDINNALNGLSFIAMTDFNGLATVDIDVSDLGNSGSGGTMTSSSTATIRVGAVSFQEGVDGYTGTTDTHLDGSDPTASFGSSTEVKVDYSLPERPGLIKFSNLFGSSVDQIPYGSTIDSVTVSIYVLNYDFHDNLSVYQMLTDWSESSTYDSMVSGISTDDVEASSTALVTFSSTLHDWVDLTIPVSVVQQWADGGDNYGFAIVADHSHFWSFASSEYATVALRPYITIDYTTPQQSVISFTNDTMSYNENDAGQSINNTLTLTDSDSTMLDGATVQITNYVSAEDSLSFTNQNGITGSWDSGTGTLTLSGMASLSNYQTALRSILYSNSSDTPDTTTRELSIGVSDAWTDSANATAYIDVVAVNDAPSGSVVVTGTAAEDQTLIADASSIADADGLGSFSYQWLRDGVAISGATGSTYTLTQSDVGAAMSVRVNYTDGEGTAESLTSIATAIVANVNDAPTGSVLITGTAAEDETLTADTSSIADEDGLGSFSYQWLRDGVVLSGATGSTYTLTQSDVGATMSVRVNYTDGEGTVESLISTATAAVANVNDAPTGSVVVTGTAEEDQTLTADASSIADEDGLGSFSYQWLRDGIVISGATGSTYTLTQSDVGAAMSVRVSYTDGEGTAESLTSTATATVANVNDAPTGSVVVTGTAEEHETLTADTSSIADEDGLGPLSYQWLRDGVVLSGATGASYLVTRADTETNLSVVISYVDGQGASETATSSPVTIAPAATDITGLQTENESDASDEGAEDELGLDDDDAGSSEEQEGASKPATMVPDVVKQTEAEERRNNARKAHASNNGWTSSSEGDRSDVGDASLNGNHLPEVAGDDELYTLLGVKIPKAADLIPLVEGVDRLTLSLENVDKNSFDAEMVRAIQEMRGEGTPEIFNVDKVALSVSTALSAGFVTWVVRSSVLMSAFLSSVPTWRGFDPLVITSSKYQELEDADADDSDGSKVERIFDKKKPDDEDKRLSERPESK